MSDKINYRIVVKLREAMLAFKRRTGGKMTYKILAERTGLAAGTLHNMGSKPRYAPGLATLAKICVALNATPGDLLELVEDLPGLEPEPSPKKTKKKKKTTKTKKKKTPKKKK